MIRVLVVDDSPLVRRVFGELFREAGDFEVAYARDGDEALSQLKAFAPQVVTLDVHMPEMDGLTCLDRIMLEHPVPVVMVSSLTDDGAEVTLKALDLGAVDFVPKPGGAISLRMDTLGPLLIDKVRTASAARLPGTLRLAERLRLRHGERSPRPAARAKALRAAQRPLAPRTADGPTEAVIVGCSTGGPPALEAVLRRLPPDFPAPILVAQHMPGSFTGPLARRLDGLCALEVVEVTRTVPLEPGKVYVGRGDADILVGARLAGLVALSAPASDAYRWHPSVDRLVASAMKHIAPERLVGVLLTGMGDDGATTMTELFRQGGRTIAEAEETAVVWGMPGELVRAGGAERVALLDEIADRLLDLVPAP